MEWNDETHATLRRLWDEGVTMAQIAVHLCTTKNAIVGKVHRLKLTPRPSPIRTKPGPEQIAEVRRLRALGLTQPQVGARLAMTPRTVRSWCSQEGVSGPAKAPQHTTRPEGSRAVIEARQRTAPRPQVMPPPRPPPPVVWFGPVRECCWPVSDGRPWRFCCEASAPGRPYCPAHNAKAYVPVRVREAA